MSFAFMIRALVLTLGLGFPLVVRPAPIILVFGDSISSAYGLPAGTGWVDLLQKRLTRIGAEYKVINASISGETAAGGRRRIDEALERHRPRFVILELGGNDGLRGARTETLQADLEAMVLACRERNVQVVLVGMRVPPNYGPKYAQRFEQVYRTIASKYRVALVPFLFEGFGERYELFQSDGIHPTREAQALMLANVWKVLGPIVSSPSPEPARQRVPR